MPKCQLAESKAWWFTLTELKLCVELNLNHSKSMCHAEAQGEQRNLTDHLLFSAPLRDTLWRIDTRLLIADE